MARVLIRILKLGIIFSGIFYVCSMNSENVDEFQSIELPPCVACRTVVDSFKKGMERTKNGKFRGTDGNWETAKLGAYSKNEVRLLEIQEGLCKDVERGQRQCRALASEVKHMMDDWWIHYQNTKDLFNYLCLEKLKRCCPENHYGPNCVPCPGYPNNICNKNGKCKGAGTKKGNGQCLCDQGYAGKNCSSCALGHYESYKDKNAMLCSLCHFSCDGPCKGAGPENCEKCAKGWQMLDGKGCLDINECVQGQIHCPGNQFCINTDGGYSCLKCDRACKGCTGDGPDMCVKCSVGHRMKGTMCVDEEALGRKKQENVTRYATYLGLCISTCIILQRNIVMAGVIGVMVSVYITISEYMISNTNYADNSPKMDIVGPVV